MMADKWDLPPKVKILEALGALADGRVEVEDDTGKVASSMETKIYTVVYEPDENRIFSNDNASKWQGYLGYPIIAFLCEKGIVDYEKDVAQALKGIRWKELNEQHDSYEEVEEIAMERCEKRGTDKKKVKKKEERIMEELRELDLEKTWRDIEVEKLE